MNIRVFVSIYLYFFFLKHLQNNNIWSVILPFTDWFKFDHKYLPTVIKSRISINTIKKLPSKQNTQSLKYLSS